MQFLFGEFTEGLIEKLVADKMDVDVYYEALNKEIEESIEELKSLLKD